eukprot:scaffold295098_cov118-Attheya_sp.AAC.1
MSHIIRTHAPALLTQEFVQRDRTVRGVSQVVGPFETFAQKGNLQTAQAVLLGRVLHLEQGRLVKSVQEGNAFDPVGTAGSSGGRSRGVGFDEDLDEDVEELRGDGDAP